MWKRKELCYSQSGSAAGHSGNSQQLIFERIEVFERPWQVTPGLVKYASYYGSLVINGNTEGLMGFEKS